MSVSSTRKLPIFMRRPLIMDRADHKRNNMGLATWKDAPKGKIQKFDVSVAKNYLTENDMAQLQRLVSAYLDVAEDMALRQIPMTMQDWEKRLNRFIEATDREILRNAGRVTAEITYPVNELCLTREAFISFGAWPSRWAGPSGDPRASSVWDTGP